MDDGSPSALARSGYLELATMAAGHAAYHWDIGADVIDWSANAEDILGFPVSILGSNRDYGTLIAPSSGIGRADAVNSGGLDEGAGVPFATEYALLDVATEREINIEDTGRWFAGTDGKPAHVFGVVRRVDWRKQQEERLKYLGAYDSQTNLLNRELILEMLHAAVNRAKNSSEPGAFLMMSVDNLQKINEIFGSDVGDSVICQVGQRVRQVMRTGDHLGRYAGNKLALVLRQCQADEMRIATQRFLSVVRDTIINTPHGPTWATVSIGGTSITGETASPKHALLSAEHALNQARRQASGQFFTDTFPEEWVGVHLRNMDHAATLLSAMQEGRLMIAFHPVRRVSDDSIAMYDVTPHVAGVDEPVKAIGDVIATARRVGLVGLINVNVLRSALATLSSSEDLCLCVPISIETLEQARTRAQVIDAVTEAADHASQLVVDIPSQDLTGASHECLRALQQLQQLGARISLNGFGMHAFPIQRIGETDGHFVRIDARILNDAKASSMARRRLETAVEIARSFGSEILVLGLDPQRDSEFLDHYHIDLVRPADTNMGLLATNPGPRPLRQDVRNLNAALTELGQRLAQRMGLNQSGEPTGAPEVIQMTPVESAAESNEP